MKTLTVGIAGTAKNTGKTTTMSYLMNEIKKISGLCLGLTSIGFDGEGFDNVTGLPKPRIQVWPGNIVAMAEKCNRFCSAALEEIRRTDIATPLGKVVISRVVSPGKVVLAGANNRRDLHIVLDTLRELTDFIIVDGALSRIAPMVEADCLIFVTGAARFVEIERLAGESRSMVNILSTPLLANYGNTERVESIFGQAGFEAFLEKCAVADSVHVRGVITVQYLEKLAGLRGNELRGKRLIFADPIKLLLAGDAEAVLRVLGKLSVEAGASIGVAKPCKLLAMTVNPYYPKYRYNRADYEEAYVDSFELLSAVSQSVNVPCFDVVKQGGEGIFKMVMDFRKDYK